jgi:HSP20 family protein
MKRLLMSALFSILLISASWAISTPTEEDYQNLEQTRAKLVRMQREMNKFMKDLASPYMDQDKAGMGAFGTDVRVDVTDSDKDIVVKADLPGMTKDKIDIRLENNRMLTISGSRDVMMKQESPGIVRQERMNGHFERVLELPAECEAQSIKATYNEGVLQIVLPKKKVEKPETIKVNVQ